MNGEFDELDAAVNARDRRLVMAAVVGLLLEDFAGRNPGFIRQPGWDSAVRILAKTRTVLLDAAAESPIERRTVSQ